VAFCALLNLTWMAWRPCRPPPGKHSSPCCRNKEKID